MYSAGARADSHIFVKLDDQDDIKGQGNFAKLKWKTVVPDDFQLNRTDSKDPDVSAESVEPEKERVRQHQQNKDVIEYTRCIHEPYTQKTLYRVEEDSSELEDAAQWEDSDEAKMNLQQPYQTVTSVGFSRYLKQLPIKELARRTDMLQVSSFNISMYPRDTRLIAKLSSACLSSEELR